MKILLLSLIAISLSGCAKPLSYEQVVEDSKYCTDRGMRVIRYSGVDRSRVLLIRCEDSEGGVFDIPRK